MTEAIIGRDILRLMRFAPEYVTFVLNENFEDAKALLLSPLMAIHYAHLVMLAEQGIVSADDAHAMRDALDAHLAGRRPPGQLRRHLRGSVLLRRSADRRACGEDVAGRLHTARCRNDIDMTMYRMRQREFMLGARRRHASTLRRSLLDLADRHRETIFAVHTHTQRAQPTHRRALPARRWSNSSSATRARLKAAYDRTNRNPLGACAITGTGFPIDRQLHVRAARLLRADRQHLRQHRHGRLPAREHVGGGGAARRPRPLRAGPAAVVHGRVRLPAPRRRLRAVQQHHAAEAQPGRARARARHRQQGARPGAGDRAHRPQHAVRRHRRHRGRSAAAGVRDVPRRHARGDARGGGDGDGGVRRRAARSARRRRLDDADRAGRYAGARPRPAVQDGARDCRRGWCAARQRDPKRPLSELLADVSAELLGTPLDYTDEAAGRRF